MKKIVSLALAGIMLLSACPMVYAADVDYTNGTAVQYDAAADTTIGDSNNDGHPDNTEAYTVTVPAQLAPGGSGNVKVVGTWASNRKLVVDAADSVVLANSINNAETKTLTVTFPGIEKAGSNTATVTDSATVSVANISDALFGTWSGTFTYDVEMQDA